MSFLIKLALNSFGFPTWAATLFGWAVPIVVGGGLLFGGITLVEHHWEQKGAAKEVTKVEKARVVTQAQAKADTHAAQATTDKIGDDTARINRGVTDYVQTKIQEDHNAFNAIPAAAAGQPLPAAPVDSMRNNLNDLAERANRSADAADAEP